MTTNVGTPKLRPNIVVGMTHRRTGWFTTFPASTVVNPAPVKPAPVKPIEPGIRPCRDRA